MKKIVMILAIIALLCLSLPSMALADSVDPAPTTTNTTSPDDAGTSDNEASDSDEEDDPEESDPGYGDIG
ncbi:hypothetical protein KO561_17195 [Radiobacillus kanasensis]|uniref:hypothetical protein n=1 Tax=Radiobacillus kanasensis TaxID=2844358 RepID=UPI001E50E17E|nr:hypothetical protein [Radiobacillus kanasensis]UFT98908.1 hypothetical protein KO561_17195 [Radiobacillus kanasensis]